MEGGFLFVWSRGSYLRGFLNKGQGFKGTSRDFLGVGSRRSYSRAFLSKDQWFVGMSRDFLGIGSKGSYVRAVLSKCQWFKDTSRNSLGIPSRSLRYEGDVCFIKLRGLVQEVSFGKGQGFKDCSRTSHQFRALVKALKEVKDKRKKKS